MARYLDGDILRRKGEAADLQQLRRGDQEPYQAQFGGAPAPGGKGYPGPEAVQQHDGRRPVRKDGEECGGDPP